MKSWILLTLLLSLLLPGPVLAQAEVRIEVDPNDTPLQITGWLGQANAFTGNLRLTAQGGEVEQFIFLASDLKQQGGDEVIGRQYIMLSGEPTLTAGIPQNFQVTVTGLAVPGTYQGQFQILLPGQARTEALTVDLEVIAKARPTLTPLPGTDRVQLRLVNCGRVLDCWLARLLLPASAFLDQWQLQFENTGQVDATVLATEIVVAGEQTGYPLTDAELSLAQVRPTLPAGQISTLPLTLNRSALPPDHYIGDLYLALADGEAWLKIPVDVSVRTGPLWPLVLLLVGLVLGRMFKFMQERGRPQSEALAAVNKVTAQINQAEPGDRQMLLPMVEAVRRLVYQEKLETVQTQLAAIEDRLEALQKLRTIEASLAGKEEHPVAQEALAKIAAARQHIARREDAAATQLIQELQNNLDTLKTALMGPDHQPDPALVEATGQARTAAQAIGRATEAPVIPLGGTGWWQKIRDWLVSLSGLSEEVRAEATLWLVRPLLYLVLLLGLLAVGLNSFYLNSGLTFGATPFADYLGLVFWGLSADVASRTLSGLTLGKTGGPTSA